MPFCLSRSVLTPITVDLHSIELHVERPPSSYLSVECLRTARRWQDTPGPASAACQVASPSPHDHVPSWIWLGPLRSGRAWCALTAVCLLPTHELYRGSVASYLKSTHALQRRDQSAPPACGSAPPVSAIPHTIYIIRYYCNRVSSIASRGARRPPDIEIFFSGGIYEGTKLQYGRLIDIPVPLATHHGPPWSVRSRMAALSSTPPCSPSKLLVLVPNASLEVSLCIGHQLRLAHDLACSAFR